MNDPKVIALIYTVDHRKSVSYENAAPLRFSQSPEFDLTVEDKIARFEFKKFYADEDEARKAIEPFIQQWEFETGIRWGPNNFSLRYKKAEIIDRDPSPPEPRKKGFGASAVLPGLTASAGVLFGNPHYPPPPSGGAVKPNDPDVKSMYNRYVTYCSGGEFLPGMAYFCLTVLEYKFKGKNGKKVRDESAEKYSIHEDVLGKIGAFVSKRWPDRTKGRYSFFDRARRKMVEGKCKENHLQGGAGGR